MHREKRSILIVDSSASMIFYVAMLLRKLDYSVLTASTAEEALTIIPHSSPAVVIVDTSLPKMSGVDLLKQMKRNSSLSFIPVMVHSADTNAQTQNDCTLAGCAGYFVKPVDPDVLYRAIQASTEATPRKNIRISVSLKARFKSAVFSVTTEDVTSLSEDGLYVKTSAPQPVKAILPLTLVVKNREINATAVVLYSSAKVGGPHVVPGMGMKFDAIKPEDRAFIREFIREQVTNALKG